MPNNNHLRSLKKLIGVVVSAGMQKTAVVAVPRLRIHSKTRRILKITTKYFCHDHHSICRVGDKVQIKFVGARISKKKTHTVIDMIQRFPQLEGEPFQFSRLKNNPLMPPAPQTGAGLAMH